MQNGDIFVYEWKCTEPIPLSVFSIAPRLWDLLWTSGSCPCTRLVASKSTGPILINRNLWPNLLFCLIFHIFNLTIIFTGRRVSQEVLDDWLASGIILRDFLDLAMYQCQKFGWVAKVTIDRLKGILAGSRDNFSLTSICDNCRIVPAWHTVKLWSRLVAELHKKIFLAKIFAICWAELFVSYFRSSHCQ